jgi:hypothetical protein
MNLDQLIDQARALRSDQQVLGKFQSYLGRRYRQARGEQDDLDWKGWLGLVWTARGLDAESSRLLHADIDRRFLASRQAAKRNISSDNIVQLSGCLWALEKKDDVFKAYQLWLEEPRQLAGASGQELAMMLLFMRPGKEATAPQRQIVARHVDGLIRDGRIGQVTTPDDWPNLVGRLKGHLDGEMPERWAAAIEKAFAGPEALAKLSAEDVLSVSKALTALGRSDSWRPCARWLDHGQNLSTIPWTSIARMSRCLATGKKDAAPARKQLAEALVARLGQPEAAKLWPSAWRDMVRSLRGDLQPEEARRLAGFIKKTFLGDNDQIAQMSFHDVQAFASSLNMLGDADAKRDILSTWMAADGILAGLDGSKLTSVAWAIGGDEKTAALRVKLIDHIEKRFLASGRAGQITLRQWESLANRLGKTLSQQQRADWAATVRAAYAGSDQQLQSLTYEQVRKLRTLLDRMGQPGGDLLLGRWVRAPANLDRLTPAQLVSAASSSSRGDQDAQAIRTAILDRLRKAWSGRENPLEVGQIRSLAKSLEDLLTAEDRGKLAAMAKRSQDADHGHGKAPIHLVEVLRTLGDDDPLAPLRRWLREAKGLTAESDEQFLDLVADVGRWDVATPDILASLAAEADRRFVAAGDKSPKLSADNWLTLCSALGDAITPEQRTAWAAAMKLRLDLSLEAVTSLSYSDLHSVTMALHKLGVEETQPLWQAWLGKPENMAGLTFTRVGSAAWYLGEASEENRDLRAALARQIHKRYVAPGLDTDKMPLERILPMVGKFQNVLTPARKQAWAKAIRGTYAADENQVQDLSQRQASALTSALRKLGDDRAWQISVWWSRDEANLKGLDSSRLVAMAREAARGQGTEKTFGELLGKVEASLTGQTEGSTEGRLKQWRHAAATLDKHLTPEARQRWIQRLRDTYAASPQQIRSLKFDNLQVLVETLKKLDDPNAKTILAVHLTGAKP